MRMHLGVNSKMALETVREHKTRSFLTVLGVVIGVAAMIFVAAILVGISRDFQGFLKTTTPTRCLSTASMPASIPAG